MTTSPNITAGSVMNLAASLLNDTARSVYSYTAQLPYLNIALQDLRKLLELNNSPVTNETSAIITIPSGITFLAFGTVAPKLPDDLIEIQQLWERIAGVEPFLPMRKVEFIPHYLEDIEINQFLVWAWINNEIRFLPANIDIDVKIDYIHSLFTNVTDENSILGVINSDSYLQYRTAALCAEYIGENPTRAMSLNIQAKEAFDILIGIDNKGRQAIYTRRRPFRAAWKNRGLY